MSSSTIKEVIVSPRRFVTEIHDDGEVQTVIVNRPQRVTTVLAGFQGPPGPQGTPGQGAIPFVDDNGNEADIPLVAGFSPGISVNAVYLKNTVALYSTAVDLASGTQARIITVTADPVSANNGTYIYHGSGTLETILTY